MPVHRDYGNAEECEAKPIGEQSQCSRDRKNSQSTKGRTKQHISPGCRIRVLGSAGVGSLSDTRKFRSLLSSNRSLESDVQVGSPKATTSCLASTILKRQSPALP